MSSRSASRARTASLTTSIADILTVALQELIEAELSARIGAEPGERTPIRTAQRNGHRRKLLSTPAGDVEVGIPKLREGSFFPELLEPRHSIDKALWAVIMRAYITGTSTRKVDDLVKALGCDSGVSKSSGSRICKLIDQDVAVLRQRRLDQLPFVYVWLDATYVHVREAGQVISKAVVIATVVRTDGHREVLGVDIGDSESETFWTEFLRDLKDRGLDGVRLVVSDAHAGLRAAIRRVFQGTGWQRCRVHAKRNLLAPARHQHRGMVSALISTIFAQPDGDAARARCGPWSTSCRRSSRRSPRCSRAWRTTCSPTRSSRLSTGPRSGPTTPSSGSTGGSSDALTSCRSSPTPSPSSGSSKRCSWRSTMNSSQPHAATWPRPPSPRSQPTRRNAYRPSRP